METFIKHYQLEDETDYVQFGKSKSTSFYEWYLKEPGLSYENKYPE